MQYNSEEELWTIILSWNMYHTEDFPRFGCRYVIKTYYNDYLSLGSLKLKDMIQPKQKDLFYVNCYFLQAIFIEHDEVISGNKDLM